MRPDDDGAGTVLVLVAVMLLSVVVSGCVGLAAVASMRPRAATAADLAALAGAARLVDAVEDPCEQARTVAAANGAELAECSVDATSVEVAVRVRGRGLLARVGPARARARAGPDEEPS